MTDREKMLQRIKHLMNHSKSAEEFGSIHEAEAFMTKAMNLMAEYNISLHEVEAAKDRTEEDEFRNWGYGEEIPYSDKHLGDDWQYRLMSCICNFNFTNFSYREFYKTLRVYGRMENVEMTVWLYYFARTGLYNLAIDAYNRERLAGNVDARTGAYAFKRDFLLGAIHGLRLKLAEEQKKNSNVMAIVKVNSEALDKFYYKDKVKPKKEKECKPKTIKVGEGYEMGMSAGYNFKFNKPLSTTDTKKQTLLK
jgi:Protein of unknown function (DUF2786)